MNDEVNKEIEEWFLDLEDSTLDKIKKTYNKSLKDVQAKAKELKEEIDKLSLNADPNDDILQSQIKSKVYQLEYQQNLEKQISNLMDVANDKNYKTVRAYLYNVYHDGFLTEQYRLMNNGVSITMPISQKLLVKAVNTTYNDIPLSTRIYDNVNKAKQNIISEISRGLSTGMSNQDMARNLQNSMGVSMRKAFQIAQNEGARVRQGAIKDSMFEAKKKGADIVKQWSATLDGKTRPVHRELDGQYAEIDEKFKYSGGEVNAPKEFGIASEDINCRCTLLSVPRWDITKTHWQLDNTNKTLYEVKNYQDWYNKYYVVSLNRSNSSNKSYTVVLTSDDLGDMFNLSSKNQKNTQALVDYVNSQNVDDNIKKIFVELDNGEYVLKYGEKNEVSYTKKHVILQDLTKNNTEGAMRTNLHELTHLKDFVKGERGYMFSQQERFMEVVANTSASMSAKVKKAINDALEQYEKIDKQLELDKYRMAFKKLNEDYHNKKITYTEYDKLWKATKKPYNALKKQAVIEKRNVGTSGLEDIYDALSGGVYRDTGVVVFGHGSKDYYEHKKLRIPEILANYTSLSVSRPDLVELLREDKPELCNMLDELIAELVKE